MAQPSTETIRIELNNDDAEDLILHLEQSGIDHSSSVSRQITGETLLVSVIVPISLTAVQIIVSYLLTMKQNVKPSPPIQKIRIEVKRLHVRNEDFSVETVEEIIERQISE